MPELMWGKADACFVPECVLNLVAKAGSVFGFAIAAWEEIGVCGRGQIWAPVIYVLFNALAHTLWKHEVERLIVLDLLAWNIDPYAPCLP